MLPRMLSSLRSRSGPFAQIDVVGVHADRFENDSVLVAVVSHPLQFVEIPGAVRSAPRHLRGEMFDAVAQVVLQVCLRRDVGSGPATLW